MTSITSSLRSKRADGSNGFTMLELVVVMGIMGILMAIAIPLYANYTKAANNSTALSDLTNAIVVVERCNTDLGTYPTPVTSGSTSTLLTNPTTVDVTHPLVGYTPCAGQAVNLSSGTTMTYWPTPSTAPYTSYLMTAKNSSGTGKTYCYASYSGAAAKQATTPITGYLTACPA